MPSDFSRPSSLSSAISAFVSPLPRLARDSPCQVSHAPGGGIARLSPPLPEALAFDPILGGPDYSVAAGRGGARAKLIAGLVRLWRHSVIALIFPRQRFARPPGLMSHLAPLTLSFASQYASGAWRGVAWGPLPPLRRVGGSQFGESEISVLCASKRPHSAPNPVSLWLSTYAAS